MTTQPDQCGSTLPHLSHGDCPGLSLYDLPAPLVIRMPRRKHGTPEVLNPEVLGGRGVLMIPHDANWEPVEQPMASTFADAEPDPLRSWMLAYPGPVVSDGPGWGDDVDVDERRCCPWCRGCLTVHNREVHAAGYSLGERHADAAEPIREKMARVAGVDPWASDGVGYDVRVLRAGIQAIASAALVREDFGTAAYAYSVLAGDPIAARYDDEPEPSAEDRAPRVYIQGRREVSFLGDRVPDTGVLLLPGDPPDDFITATEPRDESCGAAAYGVRFAACDLPPDHKGRRHHAWYDAGHGPTTVLWDN